mgnify:CR=1 FL=1
MARKHHTDIRVRFDETDGLGIVHNANYFKYFGIGYSELLRSLGFEPGKEGFAIAKGVSFPRGEAYCSYESPAKYGDDLRLYTSVGMMTKRTIKYEFELVRKVRRKRIARGHITCVAVSIGEKWKTVTLPKELVSRLVEEGYVTKR